MDIKNSNRRFLLWGDSYAAALYHGLNEQFGSNVQQLTASSCPPVLDYARTVDCIAINNFVVKHLEHYKEPLTVILHAAWTAYPIKSGFHDKLERTLDWLRDNQIAFIIVGNVPIYHPTLPEILFSQISATKTQIETIRVPTLENERQSDRILENLAGSRKGRFASALNVFCQKDLCTVKIPDSSKLIVWDYAHLTEEGSSYLINRIAKQIE